MTDRQSVSDRRVAEILRYVDEACYKAGTQFGTQKCAEDAVEAVDAVHAVRNLLSKFSAS